MFRVFPSFGALVVLLLALPSFAGVRSPAAGCFPNEYPCVNRCTFIVHGQSEGCQFAFRADGGLDQLTLSVTLRGHFDEPVVGCSTSVALEAGPGTLALCECCGPRQAANSGPQGDLQFVFPAVGGRGELRLVLTTHCGNLIWSTDDITFTSPDMNGSCEPDGSADVLDLGIWAGCLPPGPYCIESDYNCDGTVNVIDLGLFAGALTVGCDDAVCP